MVKRTVIDKMQTYFGVAKYELIAVSIIFFGLCIGSIAKLIGETDIPSPKAVDIYNSLDSLAAIQQTSYIGTDIHGNPIDELKQGDTLLESESAYPTSTKKELPTKKININTAGRTELMKLPGIGETTANRIIEYRSKKLFYRIDDIKNVKGIGDKKFESLRQYITVGNEAEEYYFHASPPVNQQKNNDIDDINISKTSAVNINTATKSQLASLPGIGPATAQKIIDYRSATPFQKIEDIKNVSGIGEKKFEKIAPFIVVK